MAIAAVQADLIATLENAWDEEGENLGNELIFRVGLT